MIDTLLKPRSRERSRERAIDAKMIVKARNAPSNPTTGASPESVGAPAAEPEELFYGNPNGTCGCGCGCHYD